MTSRVSWPGWRSARTSSCVTGTCLSSTPFAPGDRPRADPGRAVRRRLRVDRGGSRGPGDQACATDYLLKDRLGRLGQAVKQALVQRDLRDAERRARNELRASEERYRRLVDVLPSAVFVHDGERISFCNH